MVNAWFERHSIDEFSLLTQIAKSADGFAQACDFLRDGEVVAMPTETVYGLFGDATDPDAVSRIFEAKGRPQFNPLISHIDGLDMALNYGEFDPLSVRLAEAFWPGPLTLVVDRKEASPICDLACAGLDTVALRWPSKGIVTRLVRSLGTPLAGPSANRSGHVSATSALAVKSDLGGKIPLIIDGGPCDLGVESTILMVRGGACILLRPGAVTPKMIEERLGTKVRKREGDKSDAPVSPGLLTSHYAPEASLRLTCLEAGEQDIYLQYGPLPQEVKGAVLPLSVKGDMREAAARLYGVLREADQRKPSTICVAPIPMQGLGLAINDRLSRAATPRN